MESNYRNMTIEHLGSDATEEDLGAFIAACERVAQSREFRGHDDYAADFVWNHGSIRYDAGVCAYCDCAVLDGTLVPDVDDDAAWGLHAIEHDATCEWIATRSHRVPTLPAHGDTR